MRIGRALARLPQIERAFAEGRLGYTRVRELTRVARAEDEAAWLALAAELPQRVLERRVAEAGEHAEGGAHSEGRQGGEWARTSEPAAVRWASARSVEVNLTLPAATWALLERAMAGARLASEVALGDAEALEAVARDALAHQHEGKDGADPRHAVVLYRCKSCERSEVETGAGAVELDAAAAARLGCGARRLDLEVEGRAVSTGGPLAAALRRAVLLRDRMRCRAPGCSRRRYVDVHHIRAREHGGEHSRANCLCLCTTCHERAHAGLLRIAGDADGELRFRDAAGAPLERAAATPWGHAGAAGCGDAPDAPSREAETTPWGHAGAAGLSSGAQQLLAAMGSRGGWHPDELCRKHGFSIPEVMCGLVELELAGCVRSSLSGHDPIRTC